MKEVVAIVDSNGQVVLPTKVREHLGIRQGGHILFTFSDDGRVEVIGVNYPIVASLRGVAGKLVEPLSWEEMCDIGREDHLKDKYLSK